MSDHYTCLDCGAPLEHEHSFCPCVNATPTRERMDMEGITMSERFMTQEHYYEYPVRDTWRQPIDPYANLCAELASWSRRIANLRAGASSRLDGIELHELHAIEREIIELEHALIT